MSRIVTLIGNPKPLSRTRHIAESLVRRLGISGGTEARTVELADIAPRVFDLTAKDVNDLVTTVAAADLIIVATPTFKASYTGLLKSFLDRYGNQGLAGAVAIPLMTGANVGHSMAPDFTLRPLLVELGASVPTAGLYVDMSAYSELESQISKWIDQNLNLLPAVLRASLDGRTE